jgi:hypothetical protein
MCIKLLIRNINIIKCQKYLLWVRVRAEVSDGIGRQFEKVKNGHRFENLEKGHISHDVGGMRHLFRIFWDFLIPIHISKNSNNNYP